jgi:hypothetical protein
MPTLRRAILGVLPARARRTATLISLSALGALVASTAQARLLVSDETNHQVSFYNAGTGAFVDPFIPTGSGGLQDPNRMAFGPDGSLYVSDATGILRYNGQTGAFLDTFIPAGTGGLDHPSGLVFGSDGYLYVGSATSGTILRYDGGTGAFVDAFVPAGSGGLQGSNGLTFGPDGNLYVASPSTNSVLRYDGLTGTFLDEFVPAGDNGLDGPGDLAFGPDGNLYVSSANTNCVLRYDGHNGVLLDMFVPAGSGGLAQPGGIAFAPDGNLYVASQGSHSILRYNGQTGAFLDTFVSPGDSPSTPRFLLFTLDPPSGLTAINASPSQIKLSWTDNSDDETAFAIWRKGDTSDWTRVGVVPPNVTTFVDSGLTPGSRFIYRVRAISNLVPSSWTNVVSLATPDALAAPTRLAASVVSSSQIKLTWTVNSTDETAFAIWRKSGTGGWTRVGVVPPHSTTFVDAGLTPYTLYVYRVRAINNTVASAWTHEVYAIIGTAPAAPTDLTVKVVAGPEVRLTWTDNSNTETAFAIWRQESPGNWRRVGVVPPKTTAFVDTDVVPGGRYIYRVRATNDVAASAWTNEVNAIIGSAPAAPADLAVQAVSGTEVHVTWTDNSDNVTAFVIWRRAGAGNWQRAGMVPSQTTTFVDTGLVPNTTYTYLVQAMNDMSPSPWPHEVSVTPK